MWQHAVVVLLGKLRSDDWATLLSILALAAAAIFLIWIVQRASADEADDASRPPPGSTPPGSTPPPAPRPPRNPAAAAAAFAAANADYARFEESMRHNERIIEQRGIHHYNFAHKVLRGAFFEDPAAFVQLILAPTTGRHLYEHLWSRAATEAMMAGFEPLGFDVRLPPPREVTVAGRRGILFEMPPPQAPAEAYFTLALLPPGGATGGAPGGAADEPRYYTLERVGLAPGEQPADPPATVLASWSRTAHSNYGDGPPPAAQAFLDAVAAHVSGATLSS